MSPWLPALLAVLSLGAPPARSGRDAIDVRWHAPPTCPDEASVRAAIERYVRRPLSEIRDRRLSIIATAHPAESHWSLTIYTVTAEGTQERSIRYAHGCSPLADAAAVLIAMTIDPQVLGRLDAAALELVTSGPDAAPPAEQPISAPKPPPAPPEPPAERPPDPPVAAPVAPAQPSAPSAPPPRRRLTPRAAVRLAGSLGWGDLPSVGGGLGLALALRLGRFQTELAAGGWFLRSVKLALPGASGAVFDLWNLSVRAGYVVPAGRRLEVPLLLGLEAGQLHVRGVRLVGPDEARTPWFAVVLSPGLAIIPREFIAIVLGLDVLVPVTRPRFVVEDASEIFRPQPIGLRGSLGLEFRFPNRRSRSR
ncbi:hypothetical protein OV203_33475 [Nannocystis sp. ILAH1]|uniref:hypothetical protein n=1 Tax=unclassified Nannocystis TaxID=2627009 RepID=UPI00226FAF2A|nr:MULTISPECIES: hypothetical protein [unclassified Nannocystis]MCY0992098.1 hypothetical protein [Nannocystis sp. ILAH1]MCY1064349.1 hypothetical protein [Nannocystis sp. RBIL2]